MKKYLIIIVFILPLFARAQSDSPISDTLLLDKFFHNIGKCIKRTGNFYRSESTGQSLYIKRTYSKVRLGFEFTQMSFVGDDLLESSRLFPALTLSYKRHSFALGPQFLWNNVSDLSFKNPGIGFVYQINPFKEHRFLNFYFQYNFGLMSEKRTFRKLKVVDDNLVLLNGSSTTTEIENCLGYGIRVSIYKGFYLFQNMGVDIISERRTQNYAGDIADSWEDTDTMAALTISFGLGFKFALKKRGI